MIHERIPVKELVRRLNEELESRLAAGEEARFDSRMILAVQADDDEDCNWTWDGTLDGNQEHEDRVQRRAAEIVAEFCLKYRLDDADLGAVGAGAR
jgi:hypothetical protein